MASVTSNIVGCTPKSIARSLAPILCVSSLEIISPFIWMRSLKSTRCGEVNIPTRSPASLKIAQRKAETEPFPFVPAMCINGIPACGLPSAFNMRPATSTPARFPNLLI